MNQRNHESESADRQNLGPSGFPFIHLGTYELFRQGFELYNLSVKARRHQHPYSGAGGKPLCQFLHPINSNARHNPNDVRVFEGKRGIVQERNEIDHSEHLVDIHGVLGNGTLIPQPFIGYTLAQTQLGNDHWSYQARIICPHFHGSHRTRPCLASFRYVDQGEFTFTKYFRHFKEHHHDDVPIIDDSFIESYNGIIQCHGHNLRNRFIPIRLDLHNEAMTSLRLNCYNDIAQPFFLFDSEDAIRFETLVRTRIGKSLVFREMQKYVLDIESNVSIYEEQYNNSPEDLKVLGDSIERTKWELRRIRTALEAHKQRSIALKSCNEDDNESKGSESSDEDDIFDKNDTEADMDDEMEEDHQPVDEVEHLVQNLMRAQENMLEIVGNHGNPIDGIGDFVGFALRELILPQRADRPFLGFPSDDETSDDEEEEFEEDPMNNDNDPF